MECRGDIIGLAALVAPWLRRLEAMKPPLPAHLMAASDSPDLEANGGRGRSRMGGCKIAMLRPSLGFACMVPDGSCSGSRGRLLSALAWLLEAAAGLATWLLNEPSPACMALGRYRYC